MNTEVVITPNMLVIGRNIEFLPQDFRFLKSSEFKKVVRKTGRLQEINKVYHGRQQALDVFWKAFEHQYLSQLKLPARFFKRFDKEIEPGTFVLLKEAGFKKQKLLPCIVLGTNKRPDGEVNSLIVKCTEYSGPITRDIRAFAMMETDFHKLTGDQGHRVVEHELSSQHLHRSYGTPLANLHRTNVLLDSYSLNLLKSHFDATPPDDAEQ